MFNCGVWGGGLTNQHPRCKQQMTVMQSAELRNLQMHLPLNLHIRRRITGSSAAMESIFGSNMISTAIGQTAFDLARTRSLKVPGFPDSEAVQELKSSQPMGPPSYKPCVSTAAEELIVKQSVVETTEKHEEFAAVAEKMGCC